jgi:hypothetical protein
VGIKVNKVKRVMVNVNFFQQEWLVIYIIFSFVEAHYIEEKKEAVIWTVSIGLYENTIALLL